MMQEPSNHMEEDILGPLPPPLYEEVEDDDDDDGDSEEETIKSQISSCLGCELI